jgi:hypothetical protein
MHACARLHEVKPPVIFILEAALAAPLRTVNLYGSRMTNFISLVVGVATAPLSCCDCPLDGSGTFTLRFGSQLRAHW